jgi:hypothetical protein
MGFKKVSLSLWGFIIVDLKNVKAFVFESELVISSFLLFILPPPISVICRGCAIRRPFNFYGRHGVLIAIWCPWRTFFILRLFHL